MGRRRIEWNEIPASVRGSVEAVLGGSVVTAVNQSGGFSPGLAARCRLDDGRTAFIKAVSPLQNPVSPEMLRREIEITAELPESWPAPSLLASLDDGTWVVGVFDELAGRVPRTPWREHELRAVLAAMERLAALAEPSPLSRLATIADRLGNDFSGWRRLAAGAYAGRLDAWSTRHVDRLAEWESTWERAADGSALLHADIRSDNVLLDDDGNVWFVDWAHPCIGAPWIDLVFLLPSVAFEGGPDPEPLWASSALSRGVDRDAATAVLVALAGYFTAQSLEPPSPGVESVRAFQAAQGRVACEWIAERLGLR